MLCYSLPRLSIGWSGRDEVDALSALLLLLSLLFEMKRSMVYNDLYVIYKKNLKQDILG